MPGSLLVGRAFLCMVTKIGTQQQKDNVVPQPVEWVPGGQVRLVDQSALPLKLDYLLCSSVEELAEAIRTLKVRGAPTLGIAAAYGLCVAALRSTATDTDPLLADLRGASNLLRATRPTAVNLGWALDSVMAAAQEAASGSPEGVRHAVLEAARRIERENEAANLSMGRHGATLLQDGMNVLTHCNAGPLAACGIGTALGVIYTAHAEGKRLHVWVDETRPVLQGSRLTSWELMQWGVPCTLIADNMAASLMRAGRVDAVITGADRIAANGDAANKIGTYGLAVLADAHGIPFYIAAPLSTFDPAISSGSHITIEERRAREVTHHGGTLMSPEGVPVYNPAFDVTPHALIKGIITECGILRPPYQESIAEAIASTKRNAAQPRQLATSH
jgi:methylthioribose-1-phosphate isomerase